MQCHASKENDNARQKIVFYALGVLYVLSVAVVVLNIGGFVVLRYVSNDAAFSFNLLISCAYRPMTLLYCSRWPLLIPCYSVAVTLSPNLSLYAQLTMLTDSIYSSNLQRYTVAGLCGVAISMW